MIRTWPVIVSIKSVPVRISSVIVGMINQSQNWSVKLIVYGMEEGDPVHGIVTKAVHKTIPEDGRGDGVRRVLRVCSDGV